MAGRKRGSSPDEFSTTEVAEATGLSARNAAYVFSEGFALTLRGGGGAGHHRVTDFRGLTQAAVIAAFHSAGVELFLAGRLVVELFEEGLDMEEAVNLHTFLHDNSDLIRLTRGRKGRLVDPLTCHRILTQNSEAYGQLLGAHKGDLIIEILDRRYVFINHVTGTGDSWGLEDEGDTTPFIKISNWTRGTSEVVMEDAGHTLLGKMPAEWWAARQNSFGMIRANISLAIRRSYRAMDAIKGL